MKTAQLKKVIKKYFRRYHKNIKGNSLPKFSQGLWQQRFFKSHCSNPIFYKVEAQCREWATQPKMSKEGIREELTLQPRLEEYTDKPAKWLKDLEEQNKRIRKKVKSPSHVRLFVTPWTVACQAPPPMGFSRQEYWSGLPFPSPRNLPDPGIEPGSPELHQVITFTK